MSIRTNHLTEWSLNGSVAQVLSVGPAIFYKREIPVKVSLITAFVRYNLKVKVFVGQRDRLNLQRCKEWSSEVHLHDLY